MAFGMRSAMIINTFFPRYYSQPPIMLAGAFIHDFWPRTKDGILSPSHMLHGRVTTIYLKNHPNVGKHTTRWARFPKIGVPPNHPNFDKILHYEPPILGIPPFMEPPRLSLGTLFRALNAADPTAFSGQQGRATGTLRANGCRIRHPKLWLVNGD